jgi:hypothetical protein
MTEHLLRLAGKDHTPPGDPDPAELREIIEPWLSAVVQSEHLSLLLGNGFTTALAAACKVAPASMAASPFSGEGSDPIEAAATVDAKRLGREPPNVEDRIRAGVKLIDGLAVLGDVDAAAAWQTQLDKALTSLSREVTTCERGVRDAISDGTEAGKQARRLLVSFLLSFASRTVSRDRLGLFTTNYDRFVEFGCDLAGLRALDRFVGALEPVFRASRLEVDLHYNPPGIRGEPRYLEGVVRYAKVHGSLDWRFRDGQLRRVGLPFGADDDHPAIPASGDAPMIYPNPAKDVETLLFPYAELFRDMAAAACRPNSALVTFGYGFGDDHINRVLADMLTIPSTHLVVMSFDGCGGRLDRFVEQAGRPSQITQLVGPHFGDLGTLVDHYLPRPAMDTISFREAELRNRRRPAPEPAGSPNPAEGDQ